MEHIERMNPFTNRSDLMFPEHLARYMFASQFSKGRNVLDCACGNGYGSHYLAAHEAVHVTGIDIAEEAVRFSREHYQLPNLRYGIGDATRLNEVPDHSIGTYVCFETIEHVPEPNLVLKEAKRVLMPDGLLVISCPNDQIFNPDNPYHLDIYTKDKFLALLLLFFKQVKLYVQNNTSGTSILSPEAVEVADEHQQGVRTLAYPISSRNAEQADTWVAVCSDADLPDDILPVTSFFTTYSQYLLEVQSTLQVTYEENQRLARAWEQHTRHIAQLEEIVGKQQEENKKLADAWDSHTAYIQSLEARLKKNNF